MKRQRQPAPEELLAAYADDGLHPDERAAVERHLDTHPEARQELDELRATIAQTRSLAPEPASEPDWDRMLRDIGDACDAAAAPDRIGFAARLREWVQGALRPRYAVGLAVCAAVVLLVLLALDGRDSTTREVADPRGDDQVVEPVPDAPDAPETPETPDAPEDAVAELATDDIGALTDPATAATTTAADIGALDEPSLDAVLARLDYTGLAEPDSPADDDDTADDDDAADADDAAGADSLDPLLDPELAAEWSTGANSLALAIDTDEPADEIFGESDYDAFLNELSEEELDALDDYLDEVKAG